MPRGRYQQQQWDAREAAILDALETLSTERGFAQVTMDDLADEVGISKATVYQHFASKDAMLVSLMQQHTQQFMAWLDSTADQPPIERLQQTMHYLMEGHITPMRGLINVGRDEIVPVFHNSPDLMASHAQTLDRLIVIIQQGQAAGTITPDLAPSVIVSAMWALSNVSMQEYEPLQHDHAMPDQAVYMAQMITMFERSIQPKAG
ncbi:MAG: TetR/AcrR family transcriptional regulator [Anaerolineae bacterium]|nr:TetR/AcrR family transcriptional regulator [Anaerolineae bacterium]